MNRKLFLAPVVVGTAALLVLSGCSSAKSMTCEELGNLGYTDSTDKIMDLVRAHGLEPSTNPSGFALLVNDVHSFCGIFIEGEATQNLDQPIDDAVDWSEYGD